MFEGGENIILEYLYHKIFEGGQNVGEHFRRRKQ